MLEPGKAAGREPGNDESESSLLVSESQLSDLRCQVTERLRSDIGRGERLPKGPGPFARPWPDKITFYYLSFHLSIQQTSETYYGSGVGNARQLQPGGNIKPELWS